MDCKELYKFIFVLVPLDSGTYTNTFYIFNLKFVLKKDVNFFSLHTQFEENIFFLIKQKMFINHSNIINNANTWKIPDLNYNWFSCYQLFTYSIWRGKRWITYLLVLLYSSICFGLIYVFSTIYYFFTIYFKYFTFLGYRIFNAAIEI